MTMKHNVPSTSWEIMYKTIFQLGTSVTRGLRCPSHFTI
jgi:hypothetical protein